MPTATTELEKPHQTHMLFLGGNSLADGFRLIGFKTYANPTTDEVERLLRDLKRDRESAFVIVEEYLMNAGIPALEQTRREGGRVVVISVPPLKGPPRLASEVADRLGAMFSSSTLVQ